MFIDKWMQEGGETCEKFGEGQFYLRFNPLQIIDITNDGVEDYAWSKDGDFFSFSSFNEYEKEWVIEIPGNDDSIKSISAVINHVTKLIYDVNSSKESNDSENTTKK